MDLQESTLYDLEVKVTLNVAKYHPHHVTYAPANFKVAMSNGLGEDAFTRKYIIWPWLQGQGHMKCCLVPSTSCDLCTCKIWSCFFKKFMRRCVYKKIHYLTFDLGVKVTWNVVSTLYIMWPMYVQGWNCYVQSLGEDTITRNVTHGQTTDQLWYKFNIPYFSNEKAGINSYLLQSWGGLLRISVINKFETLLIISLQVLTCLLLIIFANSLDQVKGQIKVGLDLDPICLILW